jgi:aldehyde dehydrogenase (NAD+)
MGSIGYALAAGNAVVFKPSELTPGVGRALAESLAEVVPEHPLLQVVTGFGETGAALCRAGVDKLAFTGSAATAKKVMSTCAETLTPVVLECGGKDALLVDADADLDAAADAAVWGGMSNAGQSCVGVERVYVVDSVAAEFTKRVVAQVRRLKPGAEPGADLGPITRPEQVDVIRRHLTDALARGGTALVGGLESIRPPYVEPVVLTDVPEDSIAVTEETFGPTLTVHRVPDLDDAVVRVNAGRYGLGAAVFSARRGKEIASRLRCGMVAVNSVISFAGIPSLPFGGVGDSGFGRIHGADGLREFARAKAVTRRLFRPTVPVLTVHRPPWVVQLMLRIVRMRYGR